MDDDQRPIRRNQYLIRALIALVAELAAVEAATNQDEEPEIPAAFLEMDVEPADVSPEKAMQEIKRIVKGRARAWGWEWNLAAARICQRKSPANLRAYLEKLEHRAARGRKSHVDYYNDGHTYRCACELLSGLDDLLGVE